MGINVAEQVQRGIDDPQGPPVGAGGPGGKSKRMTAEHYKKHDPFYGIPSRGRNGARRRMQQQLDGFQSSRVARRSADRSMSGIPFHSKNRNNVFLAAIGAGKSRNEAMKEARRAPSKGAPAATDAGRPVKAHASGPAPVPNPRHHSGVAA